MWEDFLDLVISGLGFALLLLCFFVLLSLSWLWIPWLLKW